MGNYGTKRSVSIVDWCIFHY